MQKKLWTERLHFNEEFEGIEPPFLVMMKKYEFTWDATSRLDNNSKAPNCLEPADCTAHTFYAVQHWSHAEKLEREEICMMQEVGVVIPDVAECVSSAVFVSKKNGSLLFSMEFHLLNAITVKKRYPIPCI